MAGRSAPKVKRSIPGTQGMWCPNCGDFNAEGRLDTGGRPFIGCGVCRAINFGLTAQAIWAHKALSVAFTNPTFRDSIRCRAAKYQEEALAGTFIPGPAPAPERAAQEVAAEVGTV